MIGDTTLRTWLNEASPAGPALAAVRVSVVTGPDAGATVELRDDRLVIGTHRLAGFVVTDPTVSRFHCELVRVDDAVVVRDLGSKNGTLVDQVRVREAFARPGSVLTVGATAIRLDAGPDVPLTAPGELDGFGLMVGRSPAMQRVFRDLARAAASDATVLVLGETGTGKELAAESIHRASARADGPFIIVDCGAIPGELLESELFGHERGAFTGAVRARDGAFQAAAGGTIFLDEIGELPRHLQPKLLRALARRTVKPVGRETHVDVDVRVVAATNRDLRAEVNADRFRSDLFYRLAVVEIRLPPLRERRADIPLLVERVVAGLPGRPEDKARVLAPGFLDQLARHPWPGNVRELLNCLERSLALGATSFLDDAVAVPPSAGDAVPVDLAQPFKDAREAWTARFERAYLARLLEHHGGNIRAAARAAGIDRVHMYRLLGRHGLR